VETSLFYEEQSKRLDNARVGNDDGWEVIGDCIYLIDHFVVACTDLSDEERYTLACDISEVLADAIENEWRSDPPGSLIEHVVPAPRGRVDEDGTTLRSRT